MLYIQFSSPIPRIKKVLQHHMFSHVSSHSHHVPAAKSAVTLRKKLH